MSENRQNIDRSIPDFLPPIPIDDEVAISTIRRRESEISQFQSYITMADAKRKNLSNVFQQKLKADGRRLHILEAREKFRKLGLQEDVKENDRIHIGFSELRAKLMIKEARLQNLRQEGIQYRKRVDELKNRFETKKITLSGLNDEIRELSKENHDDSIILENLNIQGEEISKQLVLHKGRITQRQRDAIEIDEEISINSKLLIDIKGELKSRRTKLLQLEEILEEKNTIIESQKKQLSDKKEQLKSIESQIIEHNNRLEEAQELIEQNAESLKLSEMSISERYPNNPVMIKTNISTASIYVPIVEKICLLFIDNIMLAEDEKTSFKIIINKQDGQIKTSLLVDEADSRDQQEWMKILSPVKNVLEESLREYGMKFSFKKSAQTENISSFKIKFEFCEMIRRQQRISSDLTM